MTQEHCSLSSIWARLCTEAEQFGNKEPLLRHFFHTCISQHARLSESLSFILAQKIEDSVINAASLNYQFLTAYRSMEHNEECAAYDLHAVFARDPAVKDYITAILYLKGFHALQLHRLAHYYIVEGQPYMAQYLQHRNSVINGVDIHPSAKIGRGVMLDHATGIVIGETAVVGDNVSILQGVTLGGTGNEIGDRHPKIGENVMIGSGAKVLGNISIGEGARIGAGSVVLKDVDKCSTVVGVPAKMVGQSISDTPSSDMNQNILDGIAPKKPVDI